jgi:hypothetical protein
MNPMIDPSALLGFRLKRETNLLDFAGAAKAKVGTKGGERTVNDGSDFDITKTVGGMSPLS